MRPCVYRAFAQASTLLYVRLSSHWPNRWQSHAKDKAWWPEIARLDIQWLPTRRHAAWLEGYFIRHYAPKYNLLIPESFDAPYDLGTHCDQCPTWHHSSMRPPGTACHD